MKNMLSLFAVSAALVFSSCKNGSPAQSQENVEQGLNPETAARNTDIPPAFEGQTRVKGVKSQTPYEVITLNSSLGKPWGIINLPDGRFLITEKSGFANIVSPDGKSIKKVTGFPAVDAKGQGGCWISHLIPVLARTEWFTGLLQSRFREVITLLLLKASFQPTKLKLKTRRSSSALHPHTTGTNITAADLFLTAQDICS